MRSLLLAGLRRIATKWRVLCNRSIAHCGKDVHIGAHSFFWAPRGITIGEKSYLGKNLSIQTNAQIGRYALIANNVAFVGRHDHEYTRLGVPTRFGRWVGGHDADSAISEDSVIVGDDVWIGYGVIVLSGVTIGRGAIVAAGSVVTKNIEPYHIVAGVPARKVGLRFETEGEISEHERRMETGLFVFSERGYDYWKVSPGM